VRPVPTNHMHVMLRQVAPGRAGSRIASVLPGP
jgi:hypothetical protein